MSQHMSPVDTPSNIQSRALGPQDTDPSAPNIPPSPSFPYPRPSNGTYAIAWIFSRAFNSSMTYAQQVAQERALFLIVVSGFEAYQSPKQVETDESPPDPKRQRLSNQNESELCPVTVKFCSQMSWIKYRTVYLPLHSIFGPLIPIEYYIPVGETPAAELFQRLQNQTPRMRYLRQLADDGERFLEVIMKGIDGHEQEEYHFVCKRQTTTGDSTQRMECMLSRDEYTRLTT